MHKKNHLLTFALLSLSILISGCATTSIKMNSKAPKKQYKHIYLMSVENDTRNVVPKVVAGLKKIGFKVKLLEPGKPLLPPQGTGFVISDNGHILTCAHVLDNQKTATIWLEDKRYIANLIARNKKNDLALLKIRPKYNFKAMPLSILQDCRYSLGQDIYTIGFPLSDILGNAPKLNKGQISSEMGIKDDPNFLQISAQIQPGNSGGPLFNEDGQVIGIVQKTLNPMHVLARTGGALPQNVNFALKSTKIISFLNVCSKKFNFKFSAQQKKFSFDHVKNSVVQVHSGIIKEGEKNMPKIFARLVYRSIWDMWYRFQVFHLEFYDMESGELILQAGQYGDNVGRTETQVIEATLERIRQNLTPFDL